jgi:hypothetical protein
LLGQVSTFKNALFYVQFMGSIIKVLGTKPYHFKILIETTLTIAAFTISGPPDMHSGREGCGE